MDYCEAYVQKLDHDEYVANKRRINSVMRKQDMLLKEQYEAEHANGYCPICHCLRAANGKCMNGCED